MFKNMPSWVRSPALKKRTKKNKKTNNKKHALFQEREQIQSCGQEDVVVKGIVKL